MATELSAARSTNELLLAATKGEAEAVEALYTHYQQFGLDVAAEHGCDDPETTFHQAFVEAMAVSLDLSRGAPGSFASYLEDLIQDLAANPDRAEATEPTGTSFDEPADASAGLPEDESVEIDEPDELDELDEAAAWTITATIPAADLGPSAEESTIEPPATGETSPPLGVLPLAATAARPRTPNQLLDRLHPRSVVSLIAAAFLLALVAWVFLESTSSSEDPADGPTDTPPGVVTEPTE